MPSECSVSWNLRPRNSLVRPLLIVLPVFFCFRHWWSPILLFFQWLMAPRKDPLMVVWSRRTRPRSRPSIMIRRAFSTKSAARRSRRRRREFFPLWIFSSFESSKFHFIFNEQYFFLPSLNYLVNLICSFDLFDRLIDWSMEWLNDEAMDWLIDSFMLIFRIHLHVGWLVD